jgi:ketosteroid isomerase-like protein
LTVAPVDRTGPERAFHAHQNKLKSSHFRQRADRGIGAHGRVVPVRVGGNLSGHYRRLQAAIGAAALSAAAACSPASTATGPSAVAPADHAAIAEQIKADVRQTVDAFNALDAEAAVRSNAPDFVQMFHGQPNADNAANLANTRVQLADPATKLAIADEQAVVAEAGDMVFYSNRYTYTFTDPATDALSTETGNWVLIYRRQPDGSMKIFREVISDLPSG